MPAHRLLQGCVSCLAERQNGTCLLAGERMHLGRSFLSSLCKIADRKAQTTPRVFFAIPGLHPPAGGSHLRSNSVKGSTPPNKAACAWAQSGRLGFVVGSAKNQPHMSAAPTHTPASSFLARLRMELDEQTSTIKQAGRKAGKSNENESNTKQKSKSKGKEKETEMIS